MEDSVQALQANRKLGYFQGLGLCLFPDVTPIIIIHCRQWDFMNHQMFNPGTYLVSNQFRITQLGFGKQHFQLKQQQATKLEHEKEKGFAHGEHEMHLLVSNLEDLHHFMYAACWL